MVSELVGGKKLVYYCVLILGSLEQNLAVRTTELTTLF